MSNIDKQALRSKALSASPDEWIKETSDGWGAICSSDDQANGGFIIAHFVGPDSQANREFVQAANPATVLALLDELEAKDKRIADQCGIIQSARKFISDYAGLGDVGAAEFIKIIDRAAAGKGE